MKIKVLNIKEYVEKDGKYTTVGSDKMVLIKGKNGIIFTNWEYIHNIKDLITDSVRIYYAEKPEEENLIPILSTGYFIVQLKELEEKCNFIEMDSKEFFRNHNYNLRLNSNYLIFKKSLSEIGYDGNLDDFIGEK